MLVSSPFWPVQRWCTVTNALRVEAWNIKQTFAISGPKNFPQKCHPRFKFCNLWKRRSASDFAWILKSGKVIQESGKNLPRFHQSPRGSNSSGETHMNGTGSRWSSAPGRILLRFATKSSPSFDWEMPNNLQLHPSRYSLPNLGAPAGMMQANFRKKFHFKCKLLKINHFYSTFIEQKG